MANQFTSQIIKDSVTHTIIKLTGIFDGVTGQESNAVRIQANTLYGAMNTAGGALTGGGTALPFYGLLLNRCWYDVSGTGNAELFWNANTPQCLMYMTGGSEYDAMGNWVTIPNNAYNTGGCVGDIGLVTHGMQANDGYTIILELRKDNAFYQRGQLDDPASFNYGQYKITP
jgi:hypothetical protein